MGAESTASHSASGEEARLPVARTALPRVRPAVIAMEGSCSPPNNRLIAGMNVPDPAVRGSSADSRRARALDQATWRPRSRRHHGFPATMSRSFHSTDRQKRAPKARDTTLRSACQPHRTPTRKRAPGSKRLSMKTQEVQLHGQASPWHACTALQTSSTI